MPVHMWRWHYMRSEQMIQPMRNLQVLGTLTARNSPNSHKNTRFNIIIFMSYPHLGKKLHKQK